MCVIECPCGKKKTFKHDGAVGICDSCGRKIVLDWHSLTTVEQPSKKVIEFKRIA